MPHSHIVMNVICLSVCSLMEVYNDYVIDLLSFGTTLRTPLRVSEHPKTGPHVQGKTILHCPRWFPSPLLLVLLLGYSDGV